jgi:tetratricopeptide (TPR) repeat protein
MAKIALAIIIKDDTELDQLKRAVDSVKKDVDGIFITATKKPHTKIEKYCKKNKFNYSFFKWCNDFSKARNFNFSQISKDYDWIFWMDTDDVVQGSNTFQDAIKLAELNNIKAIFARYLYQVEFDETGKIKNILIEHLRERLVKNDGTFEWVAPIHETLIEKVPSGKTDFGGFIVIQITDEEKMYDSMWRNIEILQEEVINHPEDPRPIYYLAKAYFDARIPEILYEKLSDDVDSVTVELLKDYLRKSGWQEERAQAWEYLSMIHRERQEYKLAIASLLESVKEDPRFVSPYIQLALCYCQMKDWEKAMHWVTLANQMSMPKTTLIVNPRDYKTMILEAYFHIFLNTGKFEECEKVISALYEIVPSELNKQRLDDVNDIKHRNDLAHWIVKLAYHLKETNQLEKLELLVNAVPKEIAEEPVLVDLRNNFTRPKVWGDDEIVIYCGPGFEQWSPKSISKGIGGSEEAVIYLSRELSKLGWKVTVYADPRDDEGEYDGVKFIPYYKINWRDTFNILISWRQIGLFDVSTLNAKRTYLWNHDIQNPMTYTKERVDKIDKVMFLSKWHRDNVPLLDESKVIYTGNGIDV